MKSLHCDWKIACGAKKTIKRIKSTDRNLKRGFFCVERAHVLPCPSLFRSLLLLFLHSWQGEVSQVLRPLTLCVKRDTRPPVAPPLTDRRIDEFHRPRQKAHSIHIFTPSLLHSLPAHLCHLLLKDFSLKNTEVKATWIHFFFFFCDWRTACRSYGKKKIQVRKKTPMLGFSAPSQRPNSVAGIWHWQNNYKRVAFEG